MSHPPNPCHKQTKNWPRWLRRNTLELVACVIIGLGILMLLQPFALMLYTWSFVTMLAGTVMFMVVSKFPD
ncbi:MAG: hypothetical protein ACK499_09710 [Betaproteobacteria bacterium]|jgi:hypothetical protein